MEVVTINRNYWTKVGNFFLGNGFYIALTLCVALIGLSGYYLMKAVTPTVTAPVANTVTLPDSTAPTLPTPAPAPESTPTPAPTEDSQETGELLDQGQDQDLDDSAPSPQEEALSPEPLAEAAPQDFIWPVLGSVMMYHSLEVLAYDQTMGDWRTHVGMDIEAPLETPVSATCDGVVTGVYQDPWMGTTVVLSHLEGLESVYANLAETTLVAVGDQVLAGDLVGTVGATALGETANAPHLHFSITCDGEPVDPLIYLTDPGQP